MTLRARGLTMLLAAAFGILVTILDGASDGFSVWNGIAIGCFVVVGLYGTSYVTGSGAG